MSQLFPDKAYVPGIGMVTMGNSTPKEVVVPAKQETFECQVLVLTKAYTRQASHFSLNGTTSLFPPFEEIRRVIEGGRYRLDFVASSLVGGKPTLIIHERDEEE